MIPVSVVIVTKDEEKNIGDALEGVREFEEIIVVDAFSTDRTVEICKKYTDKVFSREWPGFAKQKQFGVDRAAKSWVLILDADERVTAELRKEIAEGVARDGSAGFFVPRKNYFLCRWIRHSGWWPDYTLRLFRKDRAYVEEREVHEKVIVKGEVGRLKAPLEHHTYRTVSDFVTKMNRYSTLAARELPSGRLRLLLSMFVNPAAVFLKMFVLRQGFRDGLHGLVLAVLYSFYTFLKYIKAWEGAGAE